MLDLKTEILDYLKRQEDPTGIHNILSGLGLGGDDRQLVRHLLGELVRHGLVSKHGSRFWTPDGKIRARKVKRNRTRREAELLGVLRLFPRGYGRVTCRDGSSWHVSKSYLGAGQHGDEVRIRPANKTRGKRSARVVSIEKPSRQILLGVFESHQDRVFFFPFARLPIRENSLEEWPKKITSGQVAQWRRTSKGNWKFDRFLGILSDPAVDEKIALAGLDRRTSLTDPEIRTESGMTALDMIGISDRKDFSHLDVFTVDDAHAHEFDDAIHIRSLESGEVEVGIHIADVTHYVLEDSPQDKQAVELGSSVYFPHKAYPMLHHTVSHELCSLTPGEKRCTLSVILRLDQEGKMVSKSICESIVCSKACLTYDDVTRILQSQQSQLPEHLGNYKMSLDLAFDLVKKIRQRWVQKGALNLETNETRVTLDSDGLIEEIEDWTPGWAHRIIETFMVLANGVVARELTHAGIRFPFRIHEPPEDEMVGILVRRLSDCGIDVEAGKTGACLQNLAKKISNMGGSQGRFWQTQLLKTLKTARYDANNRGHFGLHMSAYTHFTSPIRRYVDLIVHRRLKLFLRDPDLGPEYFDDSQMDRICALLSKGEREVAVAQNLFMTMKILRFLNSAIGDRASGTVCDISAGGMAVLMDPWCFEGFVPAKALTEAGFFFAADCRAFQHSHKKKKLQVGMEIDVLIQAVDLVRLTCRLELVRVGDKHR